MWNFKHNMKDIIISHNKPNAFHIFTYSLCQMHNQFQGSWKAEDAYPLYIWEGKMGFQSQLTH